MARPREFDTEEAIEGAMQIFWQQGFKATNLPELLDAMGLTRGSFYKAFADKEAVYLLALDRYDATVVSQTVAKLGACPEPLASKCLSAMFAPAAVPGRGCFICNAMVELGPENAMVAAKANAMAARLRGAIIGVLETRGVGASPEHRAELGDVVLHLYFGHQAIGKAGGQDQDWEARLRSLLTGGVGAQGKSEALEPNTKKS